MSQFDTATARYLKAIQEFRPGKEPTSVYEIPKILIADAVLRILELHLYPLDDPESYSEKPAEPLNTVIPSGFVYLMKNERNGFYKIGFSKNPTIRERTLQAEEPEVKLLFTFEGDFKDEFLLHATFEKKRIRGEWFMLLPNDVEQFCQYFRTKGNQ